LHGLLYDFPIGIFASNLPILERVEITTPYLDPLSITASSGKRPFRYAGIGSVIDEVLFVPVMDIGEPFKSPGQSPTYVLLAFTSQTPGLASSGHFQHAVISEKAHDAVEVVRVKGVTNPPEVLTDIRHRILPSDHDGNNRTLRIQKQSAQSSEAAVPRAYSNELRRLDLWHACPLTSATRRTPSQTRAATSMLNGWSTHRHRRLVPSLAVA
jgi:hypothetical protein